MNELLSHPELSQRFLLSADVVLDATGDPADEGQIDAIDLFNLSYLTVVEKMVVFENSIRDPAANPGADTQLLADILGRFWLLNSQNSSNQSMPVVGWDDAKMERGLPIVHGMQEPEDWAAVGMDFRPGQLTVPRNGVLTCQWENPTVVAALAVPAGVLNLVLKCRTMNSRRPTNLYLAVSFLASAGGGVSGPTSTQAYTAASKNPWDEDLEVQNLRMWFDGDYGAAANPVWSDTRIFRHLLVRPLIQPGNICVNGSSNYIPVIGFGIDRTLDHTAAVMDFTDEPVILDPYDGFSFRFENQSTTKTRVTVVAAIRREPL